MVNKLKRKSNISVSDKIKVCPEQNWLVFSIARMKLKDGRFHFIHRQSSETSYQYIGKNFRIFSTADHLQCFFHMLMG